MTVEVEFYSPETVRVVKVPNGKLFNKENGKSATFELSWDDQKRQLVIGGRKGTFDAMARKRQLNIVLVKPGPGTGLPGQEGKSVEYAGQRLVVKL